MSGRPPRDPSGTCSRVVVFLSPAQLAFLKSISTTPREALLSLVKDKMTRKENSLAANKANLLQANEKKQGGKPQRQETKEVVEVELDDTYVVRDEDEPSY